MTLAPARVPRPRAPAAIVPEPALARIARPEPAPRDAPNYTRTTPPAASPLRIAPPAGAAAAPPSTGSLEREAPLRFPGAGAAIALPGETLSRRESRALPARAAGGAAPGQAAAEGDSLVAEAPAEEEMGPLDLTRPDLAPEPAFDLSFDAPRRLDESALRSAGSKPEDAQRDDAAIARAVESFAGISARAEEEHEALLATLRDEARRIAQAAARLVDETGMRLLAQGDRVDAAAAAAIARTDGAAAAAIALIDDADKQARRLVYGTAANARARVAANAGGASAQVTAIVAQLAGSFTTELAAIVLELRTQGQAAADAVARYTAGNGGAALEDSGSAAERVGREGMRGELPNLARQGPQILKAAQQQATSYEAQGPQIQSQFDQSKLGQQLHQREASITREGERAISGATAGALHALKHHAEAARTAVGSTQHGITRQIAQSRAGTRKHLRALGENVARGTAAQAKAGLAGLDGAAERGVPAVGNVARGAERALVDAARSGGGALDQTAAAIATDMPERIGTTARTVRDRTLQASDASREALETQAAAGLAALSDGGSLAEIALGALPDTPLATLDTSVRQQANAFSQVAVGVARAADAWATALDKVFKDAIDQTVAEHVNTPADKPGSFKNWQRENRAAKDRFLNAAVKPYLTPETGFRPALDEVALNARTTVGDRELELERALDSGIIDVVDEGAASAAVRGMTARQGDYVRYLFGRAHGSLESYLERLNLLGDLSDNDRSAITNYLGGNTAAGAAAELRASVHWYNDEEARIEEIMRSLNADDLKELKGNPDYSSALTTVRDNLGGTDLDVFDALSVGNHARAGAYRMRDRVNEARQGGDNDALNTTLSDYSRASSDRGWSPAPAEGQTSADARRIAVQRELALVLRGTDATAATSTISDKDAAAAVETFALRDVEVTQSSGDGPPMTYTLSVTGANRDLATALIRAGEGSVDARVARLGVEMQRPDGGKILNVDTAMVDPRLNPANPVSPDERAKAQRDYAEVMTRFATTYGGAEKGITPEAARELTQRRMGKAFGDDKLSADIATALVRDGYARPDTAARAMMLSARGAGTDEELGFRFSERLNRAEVGQMRAAYRDLARDNVYPDAGSTGDLDKDMGTFGSRGNWFNEYSGDDALRLERALIGKPTNDREQIEAAAFAAQQQRENTGGFGAWLAGGSLAEESLALQEKDLAGQLGGATVHVDAQGRPVWMRDGREITPGAGLFDEGGRFTGDRAALLTTATMTQGAAENYAARIDAYANFAATTVAVLGAIAATVATVVTGGAASPLLMASIAALSGLAGMGVRAAISGGRYGWEQAATDLGMTAVQALTAGVGQHIALLSRGASGGFAAGMATFRSAEGLAEKMGAISGSALMDMLIMGGATGGIGGLGSTMMNEATWQKGLGNALGELLTGAMRGILSGTATSLASQAFEKIPLRGSQLGEIASETASPLTRGTLRAASSAVGGFAGREVEGVLDPHAHLDAGDLFQSGLEAAGQSAVQDFAGGTIEGHIDGRRRAAAEHAANRPETTTAASPDRASSAPPHEPITPPHVETLTSPAPEAGAPAHVPDPDAGGGGALPPHPPEGAPAGGGGGGGEHERLFPGLTQAEVDAAIDHARAGPMVSLPYENAPPIPNALPAPGTPEANARATQLRLGRGQTEFMGPEPATGMTVQAYRFQAERGMPALDARGRPVAGSDVQPNRQTEARIHSPDPKAQPGSNSREGWTMGIEQGNARMLPDGRWFNARMAVLPDGTRVSATPYDRDAAGSWTHRETGAVAGPELAHALETWQRNMNDSHIPLFPEPGAGPASTPPHPPTDPTPPAPPPAPRPSGGDGAEGTASAVGRSFRGNAVTSGGSGATEGSVRRAMERIAAPESHLGGVVTRVPDTDIPTVRLKPRGGGEVEVEIHVVPKLEKVDGEVPVARFVFDKETGRYRVEVSAQAPAYQVERALAHELAEIGAAHGRAALPDALAPGSRSAALSPHDEGRLAEFDVLARQLANPSLDPVTRARLRDDAEQLADHLGLVDSSNASRKRAEIAVGALPEGSAARAFLESVIASAPTNPFVQVESRRFNDDLPLLARRYEAALAMNDKPLAESIAQDLRRLAITGGLARAQGSREHPSTSWLDGPTRAKIAGQDAATRALVDHAEAAFKAAPRLTDADRRLLSRVSKPDPGFEPHYETPREPNATVRPDPTRMSELVDQRAAAYAQQKALEASLATAPLSQRPAIEEKISRLREEVKNRSEDLGTLAGRAYAEQVLRLPVTHEPTFRRGSDVPDLLYTDPVTGRITLIECKGGVADLGVRRGPDGTTIVAQGTLDSVLSLAMDMQASTDPRVVKLGVELEIAAKKNPPNVDYYLVKQPIDPATGLPTTPITAKFKLDKR